MHPNRTIISGAGFRCAIGASYAPLSHTNIRSPSVVRLGAARNPPDRPNEHPRADGGRTRAACAAPTPPQSADSAAKRARRAEPNPRRPRADPPPRRGSIAPKGLTLRPQAADSPRPNRPLPAGERQAGRLPRAAPPFRAPVARRPRRPGCRRAGGREPGTGAPLTTPSGGGRGKSFPVHGTSVSSRPPGFPRCHLGSEASVATRDVLGAAVVRHLLGAARARPRAIPKRTQTRAPAGAERPQFEHHGCSTR